MIKLIAEYEDTEENLEFFARSKGWTEQHKLSMMDFVREQSMNALVQFISGPAQRQAMMQLQETQMQQQMAEAQVIQDTIKQRLKIL